MQRKFHDGRLREEANQTGSKEKLAGWPLARDVQIAGKDDPVTFLSQGLYPLFVLCVGLPEFIAVTDDLMITGEQRIQPTRQNGRQVVIYEELHELSAG